MAADARALAKGPAISILVLEARSRLCLQKEVGELTNSLSPAPGAGRR